MYNKVHWQVRKCKYSQSVPKNALPNPSHGNHHSTRSGSKLVDQNYMVECLELQLTWLLYIYTQTHHHASSSASAFACWLFHCTLLAKIWIFYIFEIDIDKIIFYWFMQITWMCSTTKRTLFHTQHYLYLKLE